MPSLAARLALTAAGAVIVMTGIEALRWRHPKARAMPPMPDEPPEEPPPASPRFAPILARAPAMRPNPPKVPHGPLAMARIRGRVVGSGSALESMEITVENVEGTYEPLVDDDGTFEIHLPPGSYGVAASAGSQVALAEVADLAPDEDREVALVLAESVPIQGRVEGCDGPCADATIAVVTSGIQVQVGSTNSDAQGDFVLDGLVPGQAYDLAVEVSGKRKLAWHGIVAPAQGVVAIMEPSATLVGGFGIEPGEDCPMQTAWLEGGQDDDEQKAEFEKAEFDSDCRFRIEGLPALPRVRLRANGKGWHFNVEVALPEHGDPPFLCLRAPCREPVPEPMASLAVTIAGGPGQGIQLQADLPDSTEPAFASCFGDDSACVLDHLRARPGVSVVVHAVGCEPRTYILNLIPGPNYLTSPCASARRVRGIIRGATTRASVRCSSRHPAHRSYGRAFVLHCPEPLTTIEYQVAESGPWRTASVVSDRGEPLAIVSIDVM